MWSWANCSRSWASSRRCWSWPLSTSVILRSALTILSLSELYNDECCGDIPAAPLATSSRCSCIFLHSLIAVSPEVLSICCFSMSSCAALRPSVGPKSLCLSSSASCASLRLREPLGCAGLMYSLPLPIGILGPCIQSHRASSSDVHTTSARHCGLPLLLGCFDLVIMGVFSSSIWHFCSMVTICSGVGW